MYLNYTVENNLGSLAKNYKGLATLICSRWLQLVKKLGFKLIELVLFGFKYSIYCIVKFKTYEI